MKNDKQEICKKIEADWHQNVNWNKWETKS